MRIATIILCFVVLLANSCKNEIEINAPWKETPVVYAFVDPNTSTQYFRIQKTYQNSTDLSTAEGAQIADSLYFDTLIVKVIEGNNVYTFTKTANTSKDGGFFASNAHFLYKCDNFTGKNGANYTLQIFSPKTGNTYSSSTKGIGAPVPISAVRLRLDASILNSASSVTTTQSNGSFTNSQAIRLVYFEYKIGNASGDTLNADFVFSEGYNANSGNFRIATSSFINAIKAIIPQKDGFERKVIGIDFINVSGGREVADIIELSTPSISIVQKKIDYTNITNALGIFSSRSYQLTKHIENFESRWATNEKQNLINSLNAVGYTGINSKNLNFVP